MTAGRPVKFANLDELQAKIDAYFDSCYETDESGAKKLIEPLTITGLALALDTTRETLCNYAEKEEFSDTVRRAKLRVENFAEKQLFLAKSATGPIFALKNFGWADSQNLNHGGQIGNPINGKITVELVRPGEVEPEPEDEITDQ